MFKKSEKFQDKSFDWPKKYPKYRLYHFWHCHIRFSLARWGNMKKFKKNSSRRRNHKLCSSLWNESLSCIKVWDWLIYSAGLRLSAQGFPPLSVFHQIKRVFPALKAASHEWFNSIHQIKEWYDTGGQRSLTLTAQYDTPQGNTQLFSPTIQSSHHHTLYYPSYMRHKKVLLFRSHLPPNPTPNPTPPSLSPTKKKGRTVGK